MELFYKGKKLGAPIYAKQFGSSGVTLGRLYEGSIIRLNENGSPIDFYVAEHDYELELNGSSRSLIVRKDVLPEDVKWNEVSKNTYADSTIDMFLNSDYKNSLDPNIQEKIATTKFYYTPMNGDNNVSTLDRSVFLLSYTEFGLSSPTKVNSEGSICPFIALIRCIYGTAAATRSPVIDTVDKYMLLGGGSSSVNQKNRPMIPCFTLPSDFVVYD